MRSFPKWIFCVIAFWAVCEMHSALSGGSLASALGFNMLLAVLPYVFSRFFVVAKKLWIKIVLFIMWILFLPNTFYMITDLIHVPEKMEWISEGWVLMHTKDILHWLLLLIIGFGCIMAFLFGLESIYIMIKKVQKKAVWHLSAALASGLCGFGIYMGRFLRLNSWDVLHPFQLIYRIFSNLDGFALIFTFMMSLAILILFYFYIWFSKEKDTIQ